MNRFEMVKQNSDKGLNCAQAIVFSFADLTNINPIDWIKITECLGGGIGRMQGICGALSGAFLILSYLNSDGIIENSKTKPDTYAKIRELNEKFIAKLGSNNCLELLNGEVPKPGKCNDKLQAASEILEEMLIKLS